MGTRRDRRGAPAAWVRFGLLSAVCLPGYLLLPTLAQEILYPLGGLACVVAIARGLVLHRPARPAPWLLLAAGLVLWTLGDVAYSLYDVLAGGAPFPSWADLLYASGYPSMVAAVVLVLRRSGVRDTVAWQDAGIWTLAAFLLGYEWLVEPVVTDHSAGLLARLVATGFPVLDLLLLFMLLRLLGGRRRARIQGLLALALSGYLASDVVYGIQSLAGTYASGGVIDLGWIACYAGIGTLALHPRMTELTEPVLRAQVSSKGRLRWAGLGAAALLAPGMLATQQLAGKDVDVLVIAAAAAAMFLLTTSRGAGLVRELQDTTASLRDRELELHRRATTDALTGLANRSALQERLATDTAAGRALSVAVLDVDDFKHVNDSRGHEAGDSLLREISSHLRAGLPAHDLVARLGGDEFAIVSSASAEELAARLTASVPRALVLPGDQVELRISIGVAAAPAAPALGGDASRAAPDSPEPLASVLLRQADIAMYAAKGGGGGQAVVYRPEMSAELLLRLQTQRQLAEAVEQEQFAAWLQPVVDLDTGQLHGFEALVRWEREDELVGPERWMPVAEETGLVAEIDLQVLRAATRQLVRWTKDIPGADALHLAANASGRSLQEPGVAQRVLDVLREEGLDPRRFVLEVTEGVLIDESVGARLQRLRDVGVRIALDDFGTGWSSLAYLRRFPVDVLKIDRTFVAGITDGHGADAIPAAVLQLAAALELHVIAEGVETPAQVHEQRRRGCRHGQGYLLGHPAAPARLEQLVRTGRVADTAGPGTVPTQPAAPEQPSAELMGVPAPRRSPSAR